VFLFLSKALDWLLGPLAWAMLLMAAGLVLRRRRPRLALGFALSAAAVLLLFSMPAVSNALDGLAESGAVRTIRPGVTYAAVIVLGGGTDPDATLASGSLELNAAGERVLRGFELLQSGWARNVLLSAGTLDPSPDAVAEATILASQLEVWGIDGSRIFPEPYSRNTRENAVESAKIVRAQGWRSLVLVTSAAHLPRALGCFKAVGLTPDALPVDHRHAAGARGGLIPRSECLARSTDALRELFGRLIYRVVGYTAP